MQWVLSANIKILLVGVVVLVRKTKAAVVEVSQVALRVPRIIVDVASPKTTYSGSLKGPDQVEELLEI